MIIRPVLEHELSLLREISIETFVVAFGHQNTASDMALYIEESRAPALVEKEFHDDDTTLLFVEVDGDVVGYMKINQGPAQTEIFDQSSLELERIYLLDGHQGKGYGECMMKHFEQMGLDFGVAMIWLGVWKKNPRAVTFYQRHGFEIFDEHDYLLGTDLQRDYLMQKVLK